jgi:NhaP-type Na+/H+ or K+/H+ antiporter
MHAAAAAVLVVGLAAGLALGWAARPATRQAQEDSQAMALTTALAAYNLDYLGDAPGGSLADSYLALLTNRKGGRQ